MDTREVKKLRKKLAKAERAYEKAEGKPLAQARILRAGASVTHKLERIKKQHQRLSQLKGGVPDEESKGNNRDEQTQGERAQS